MNLFYRRPLSLILCIMLGGFSLFAILPDVLKPCSLLAIIPLLLVLTVRRFRRALAIVAFSALLVSFLSSYLYFDCWFKAYERFDGEVEVSATVTEIDKSIYYSTTLTLKTDNIDDEAFSSAYNLRATVSPESALHLAKGCVVKFTCRLNAFEDSFDFDANSYYTARGISADAEILERDCYAKINLRIFCFVIFRVFYIAFRLSSTGKVRISLDTPRYSNIEICVSTHTDAPSKSSDSGDCDYLAKLFPEFSFEFDILKRTGLFDNTLQFCQSGSDLKLRYTIKRDYGTSLSLRAGNAEIHQKRINAAVNTAFAQIKKLLSKSS